MSIHTQSSASETLALTNAELAKSLGISPRHLYTLDRSGRIGPAAIRLGHSVRWPRSEIEAWLAAGAPDRQAWEARKRA